MTPRRAVRTWDRGQTMSRRRIAIACQGGGSQCAFVAGALDELFSQGIQDRYEIVGLSGTSGGAITAAAAWTSLLKRAQGDPAPISDRINALWKELDFVKNDRVHDLDPGTWYFGGPFSTAQVAEEIAGALTT